MTDTNAPRIVPGWPTLLLMAFPMGVIVYLQATEGFGDEGMNNAICYGAAILLAVLYALWFLIGSRQPGGRRLIAVVLGSTALVVAALSVEVVSWSGAMIPELRFSWQKDDAPDLEATTTEATAAVDVTTTTADDFPGFLGPNRDGRVSAPLLARDWNKQPPEVLWTVPVGYGWSGFAVVNGVCVTQEQRGDEQVVVARDVETGSELWRYAHPGSYESVLAGNGPRATPTIHAGRVYVHGVRGRFLCLDGATGTLIWQHDLMAEYGMTDDLEAEQVGFGRSPSPLIYGDMVLLPAGGNPAERRSGIVAFDAATGEIRWEGLARNLSHGSPTVSTLAGVEQIVVPNETSISGHDPSDGALLWEHPWPGKTSAEASNSQPTTVGDAGVLMSKGYGRGSSLIQVVRGDDGTYATEVVWASRRALQTKFTNPVVRGEYAYALSDGILECVSLADGKRVWKDGRFGHGQLLLVEQGGGALLLVLSEEGELILIEASPESEGEVLASLEVLDGKTWNTFALYGALVVCRNGEEATCLRLPLRPE